MKKINFTIRKATPKDIKTIVDLRRKLDVFEHRYNPLNPVPSRAELLRQIPGYIKDKNFLFFIAEVEGRPVGFSVVSIKKSEHTKKKTASLDAIWVEPRYRRQGIGRALTDTRLKQLAKYKLAKILVYIRPDNTPSQANIKSFGGVHTYNVYQFKPKKK
ncbi:MAG: N-acetyltransferase [Patescibacteria group bacterium]|nr:N-acetyltransferase [Patescibacteria group bacterium]